MKKNHERINDYYFLPDAPKMIDADMTEQRKPNEPKSSLVFQTIF